MRICALLGLNHLDKNTPFSQFLPLSLLISPEKSWLYLEERRRTFWFAQFCCLISSHISSWPSSALSDEDITTCEACNEHNWRTGIQATQSTSFESNKFFVTLSDNWMTSWMRSVRLLYYVSRTVGLTNPKSRRATISAALIEELHGEIKTCQDSLKTVWLKQGETTSNTLIYSQLLMPLMLTYLSTLIIHVPRCHPGCVKCPHLTCCLNVIRDSLPYIQELSNDVLYSRHLNPLIIIPAYLIGRLLIDEWSYRGDPFGFIDSTLRSIQNIFQLAEQGWTAKITAKTFGNRLQVAIESRVDKTERASRTCPCLKVSPSQRETALEVSQIMVKDLLNSVYPNSAEKDYSPET